MSTIVSSLNGVIKSLLLICMLLAAPIALARDFPARPVTIVIPSTPGGATDSLGRFLAERLGKLWNQTVIVENRPGAGSAVGAAHVVQAKPDGYTLLFFSVSLTTSAAVQTTLPYDPAQDLQPVGMVASSDLVVLTGARTPISSLEDLQNKAKSQSLFYGTPGVATLSHLSSELLNNVLGIKMEPVHYRGGSEVIADMGGNRIDVYICSSFDAMRGVGKPIAVMSEKRSEQFPDVPTMAEAGYREGVANMWWGSFAPSRTPKDIVTKINRDIAKVMRDQDAVKFLAALGARPSDMSVERFAALFSEEVERWTAIGKKHGFTAR